MATEIDWLALARADAAENNNDRHYLHMHPEPGNSEHVTSAYIRSRLDEMGIGYVTALDTAVIASVYGCADSRTDSGAVVALRADMDALPIDEATGCDFQSLTPGMMHACGHDVHMAAALGAARLLNAHRDAFSGEVRILFQPDEEGSGGAERLVKAGFLKGVSACFGAHVSPALPAGKVGVRFGKFYAASDVFTVTVHGLSAHGAEPENGRDALLAACRMVSDIHDIPLKVAPERCVVTTGRIEGGTAGNIICDRIIFTGIMRTLGADSRRFVKQCFKDIIEGLAAETGTTADINIRESYPGVVNTDTATGFVRETCRKLLGAENVMDIDRPTMTTEDFGYYIDEVGGSFYHIGVGGDEPLHGSKFLPPDSAAVLGAAVHAAVICCWLNRNIFK